MLRRAVLSTKSLAPSMVTLAKEAGIDITEASLIATEPIITSEKKGEIEEALAGAGKVMVFTSAQAVTALLQNGVGLPQHSQVFCLSGKTRHAVERYPQLGTIAGTADNAAVLAKLITDQNVREVVFFCGDRRREELPSVLAAGNIKVKEIVVYRTHETPRSFKEAFDAVLFFSPSAVESFFACNQLSEQTVCFAIGRTTANAIAAFTGNKTVMAAAPGQEQLITLLIEYFT